MYKMVWYEDEEPGDRPKVKVAGKKSTWPGKKEVYRLNHFERDIIQLEGEPKPKGGTRLLKPVISRGQLMPGSMPPLSEIWEFAQRNLQRLPEEYHALIAEKPYPVELSEKLKALRQRAIQHYGGGDELLEGGEEALLG